MTIRKGTFYPLFPVLDSKPLNLQWGFSRSNTAETKALVRNSYQELEEDVDELNAQRALVGQAYGDLDFSNKYRIFYNGTTEEFCLQKNDGTVASPSWTDMACFRFHDGQFQVVSTGGISSAAGFYGSGLQSIEEVAESGTDADVSITNPTKIFFNTDDGLEVQEISSGANKGQPEVRLTIPYGKAQSFTKSGKVWQVDHNFGITPVLVQVMDRDDRVVIPDKADLSDPNTAWFYFNEVFSGSVYVASGGVGAASLAPKDPFYLAIRTDDVPAAPGNTLKPNADVIFDSTYFYVNVDLDDDAGGAHKKAYIHLTAAATDPPHLVPRDGSRSFTGHVRMDDTLNVENAVTAEAFYTITEGDLSDHGSLNGLSDDDHTQYALVDGTRDFTGHVTINNNADSAINLYIDSGLTSGQQSAIHFQDRASSKWLLNKLGTNSFVLYDAVEGISTIFVASHADNEYALSINYGNVGIGLVAPSHKLHVVGDGYFTEHVRMDDTLNVENIVTAEAFYTITEGDLSDHGSLNGLSDDDHTQYVLVDGTRDFTGNVTIDNNADSESSFTIDSGLTAAQNSIIYFQDQGINKWWMGKLSTNAFLLYDIVEGISTIFVGSHADNQYAIGINYGNVGIGLADPSHKLHVVGDGYFTEHVRMDDTLNVENIVTAEAFYVKGDGFLSSLRIREQDGTPDVQNIKDIIVGNGALTDNGDGTVMLATGTGGGINIKDENNVYLGPDNLIFANKDFYLTNDSNGHPVANLQPIDHGNLIGRSDDDHTQYALVDGSRSFTGHVRMDDTLNVENAVTAEAFYLSGGGEVSLDESNLHISSSSGDVIIADDLHVGDTGASGDSVIDFQLAGALQFRIGVDDSDNDKFKIADSTGFGSGDLLSIDQTGKLELYGAVDALNVENSVRAEAFYYESGGEAPQSYVESFTSAVEWTVNHNLNRPHFIAQAFKTTGEMLTPDAVFVNDRNIAYFYFSSQHAGKAVIFGVG